MAKRERLLERAREHLEEGEKVVAVVDGSFRTRRTNRWRRAICAATDRRLILYAKKSSRHELDAFDYERISSIETRKGLLLYHVSVFALEGEEVTGKSIAPEGVAEFVELVRRGIADGSVRSSGASASRVLSSSGSEPISVPGRGTNREWARPDVTISFAARWFVRRNGGRVYVWGKPVGAGSAWLEASLTRPPEGHVRPPPRC